MWRRKEKEKRLQSLQSEKDYFWLAGQSIGHKHTHHYGNKSHRGRGAWNANWTADIDAPDQVGVVIKKKQQQQGWNNKKLRKKWFNRKHSMSMPTSNLCAIPLWRTKVITWESRKFRLIIGLRKEWNIQNDGSNIPFMIYSLKNQKKKKTLTVPCKILWKFSIISPKIFWVKRRNKFWKTMTLLESLNNMLSKNNNNHFYSLLKKSHF